MSKDYTKLALTIGLVLVIVWASKHATFIAAAMLSPQQIPTTQPSSRPYPERPTLEDPTACSTRTAAVYNLERPPLMPPQDNTFWGCWPGYKEAERGPQGSVSCVNRYNNSIAPPQKFKHTGNKWLGCSFEIERDVWRCPTCSI